MECLVAVIIETKREINLKIIIGIVSLPENALI